MLLDYLVMFVVSTVFRVASLSFILVYLDNWSIIPIIILWTLNLILRSSVRVSLAETVVRSSAHSGTRGETVLVVEDAEDISHQRTMIIMESRQSKSSGSVLLDTSIGLFIPCMYLTHWNPSAESLQHADINMRRFFRKQIFIINGTILVILSSIFYLVYIDRSFNYNNNIMDPATFLAVLSNLIFLGFVGIIIAKKLDYNNSSIYSCEDISKRRFFIKLFKKSVKMMLMLTLIFTPLITTQLLISSGSVSQTPTFVFFMKQSDHSDSQIHLNIFASWDMMGRSVIEEEEIISGVTYSDCSLESLRTDSPRIFIMDTNQYQCRYLLEDKHFLQRVANFTGVMGTYKSFIVIKFLSIFDLISFGFFFQSILESFITNKNWRN